MYTRLSRKACGLLAALIMGLLLASGLTGCKGKAAGTQQTAGPVAEFEGGWRPTTDLSKKVNLTLATVMTVDGYDYTAGDDYAKYWSDRFNYSIDITALSFDNWAERLRIWISSGDMPDVVIFDYKHPDAAGWVDQGLIKKFPDNWKTRWPNLARAQTKSSLGPEMEKLFDGTYFIARPRFDTNLPNDPLPDHISLYYRKDWAQQIGFPIKDVYSTSEVIEFARQMKQKDPGNVGGRLLGLSNRPEWAGRLFVAGNSTHYRNFYKDKDGKYKWGPASQDTLTGLKLYYKAYNEGILNKEFYTLNYQEDYDQLYVSGISAMYFGEAVTGMITGAYTQFQKYLGDPSASIGLASVVGEDGNYHQEDLINFWGCIAFSPSISDDAFERWMDILDFRCTDYGYAVENLGLEGIDWRRGADGEYVSLLPEGTQLAGSTGKYPSMLGITGAKLSDDFSFQNPTTLQEIRDISWKLYQDRSNQSTADTFTANDWTLYTFDSPNMRKAQFDYATDYANMVVSAKSEADLEAIWRRWIETAKPIVDPVLAELNALK